jgi:hypothetical protein
MDTVLVSSNDVMLLAKVLGRNGNEGKKGKRAMQNSSRISTRLNEQNSEATKTSVLSIQTFEIRYSSCIKIQTAVFRNMLVTHR